jgi:FXSXX-COOH protein
MLATEKKPREIPSSLADLTDIPLETLAGLDAGIIDEAIGRVIPESLSPLDTPFNSAI